MDVGEPEPAEEPGEGATVVGRSERRRWIGRLAAPGSVPGDDGELIPELVELVAPFAAVGEPAVEEDDGRPLAGVLVGDAEACDVEIRLQAPTRAAAPSSESRISRSSCAVPTKIGVSRSV
jgi:hypothetical protein